jgi:Ser/Thr protein kinase RdoA (MazF antagonist)
MIGDSAEFSSETTLATLRKACAAVDLEGSGAELLRLGENALYQLRDAPIVARIARTTQYLPTVRMELAVARWLAATGLPAARVVASLDQPQVVGDQVVTFWELIQETAPKPTVAELGAVLSRLHSLHVPDSLDLPEQPILGRTLSRIDTTTTLSSSDREFLHGLAEQLREEHDRLRFVLPAAAIHGDADVSNLMRGPDGAVRLIDFESFAYGPPEWDLALTAAGFDDFDDESPGTYQEFVDAYGYDVRAWDGYDVLRRIYELKMTTWLMQNVDESPKVAAEFDMRMRDLRDPSRPRRWHGF